MTGRFAGQVAMVTGAAQNIGFGVALRLASEGAAIVALDRDPNALRLAVGRLEESGARALGVVADVSSRAEVTAAVASGIAEFGGIDVLVNNAGIWITKSLIEHTDEDWDRVLAVNLTGTFICSTAVLPGMIERGSGVIVNLSSIAASHYTVPHASYAASKAGVSALTRDLAYEVAPLGIRVNAIAPGTILPPADEQREGYISNPDGLPLGPGSAADIGGAVAYLASDDARYVIGVTLPVAGGGDLALNYGEMGAIRDRHLGSGKATTP